MPNATWPGGFIRKDSTGRTVYVIRRMIDGHRYTVSTRATTLRSALEHLRRFEADPARYRPRGGEPDPIYITDELVEDYVKWCRDTLGNDRQWVNKKKRYLGWWADALQFDDLRRTTPATIKQRLVGATGQRHRIEALKHFLAFLRTELYLIEPGEDPTYGRLPIPAARPAQWNRNKAIDRAQFEAVRNVLTSPWRDILTVQGGSGLHVTEALRFGKGGRIDVYRGEAPDVAAVLVVPRMKIGNVHRIPVTAEVRDAAERLLKHGGFSVSRYYQAIKTACEAAGIVPFAPGQLRHTVATFAVEAGAVLENVSAFLNHESVRTTRRFYSTNATPTKVPTLV